MKDLRKFISTTIREYLNESDDNYSSFKNMKPYYQRKDNFINSIKSFNDIDDNKIREIFDLKVHFILYSSLRLSLCIILHSLAA